MKNYRFYGEEMEALGQRLDAARTALSNAKTDWAQNYWQQNVERLLLQWRLLPILHDGEAQLTIIPRWEVMYDSFEKHDGSFGHGLDDKVFEFFFKKSPDLEWSWNNNREKRLAKAQ